MLRAEVFVLMLTHDCPFAVLRIWRTFCAVCLRSTLPVLWDLRVRVDGATSCWYAQPAAFPCHPSSHVFGNAAVLRVPPAAATLPHLSTVGDVGASPSIEFASSSRGAQHAGLD